MSSLPKAVMIVFTFALTMMASNTAFAREDKELCETLHHRKSLSKNPVYKGELDKIISNFKSNFTSQRCTKIDFFSMVYCRITLGEVLENNPANCSNDENDQVIAKDVLNNMYVIPEEYEGNGLSVKGASGTNYRVYSDRIVAFNGIREIPLITNSLSVSYIRSFLEIKEKLNQAQEEKQLKGELANAIKAKLSKAN